MEQVTRSALRNLSSIVSVSKSHANAVMSQGVVSTISNMIKHRNLTHDTQFEAKKTLVAIASSLSAAGMWRSLLVVVCGRECGLHGWCLMRLPACAYE